MLVLLLRLEQSQGFTETLKDEIVTRNRRLPDFKRVGGYLLCSKDFPRTASMKIKRAELAEDTRKILGCAAVVEL
jgi:acyl-coenzyme A synthetase/AMP-(fatty) acid ligase